MDLPRRIETPQPLSVASEDLNPIKVGQQIVGRYEIVSLLGKGGGGDVWRAYDLKLRMDVALKSIRSESTQSEEAISTIRNEVRTAREVISPNVCRLFDLVDDEDRELISMEYIDGITLLALLIKKGPIPFEKANDIASQFLSGLDAIHKAGFVHCDIKPENIMITRTGRVVVMDFGIAKTWKQRTETITGTIPYMSPEQLSGKNIDSRSDIYSAGIVLQEMIHPDGIITSETREQIWTAIRINPRELPDNPWRPVIERAVASDPADRFASASELARALEEATQRTETAEVRTPYPGLVAFSGSDSDYFFGRELELETLLKKLQQLHLSGLIGPSGAGKTSFLRAGFIPVLPEGWSHVFCVPGDSPSVNLGQALVPHLTKNTEAMQKIMQFDQQSVAMPFFEEWRQKHAEVLLIIDRFEELFTLNPPEIQERFVSLIRIALETGVRVLLSMRDDFLFRCHHFPALAPIFSDITPLGPPEGPALRRALTQPALKCGYRFEDEEVVDDILSHVERERGALPLMAFAAFRLWQKRDRDTGRLTRQAYEEIGGVAGALAQHAEETLERIGIQQEPIVREIFRNLITVENTRVARDLQDLLSVFGESGTANRVMKALIDARLLTTFEAQNAPAVQSSTKVEIIHESLITAWPRLVAWQVQDAEMIHFREHLRQAAQAWQQRNQPPDLLWKGTAFREFELWKERYPGSLTETERSFVKAMMQDARKRRKQRMTAVTATFVVLLGVIAMISFFWRNALRARNDAVLASHLAEAGKVLATGRAISNADPSTKLAYAIASLELSDTPGARRFAAQALSEGSPAQVLEIGDHFRAMVSPNNKWIVVTRWDGTLELLSRNGEKRAVLEEAFKQGNFTPWNVEFSPDGELLILSRRASPNEVKVWSLSQQELLRTFTFEGITKCLVRGGKAFFVTDLKGKLDPPFAWHESIVRLWRFDANEPQIIGQLDLGRNLWASFEIDLHGKSIVYKKNHEIFQRSIGESDLGPEKLILTHPQEIMTFALHPNGDQVAFTDVSNDLRIWGSKDFVHLGKGEEALFDRTGRFLLARRDGGIARWDLPAGDAEPHMFRAPQETRFAMFDNQGDFIVADTQSTAAFIRLTDPYPYIYTTRNSNVRFSPDGRFLISGFRTTDNIDGVLKWSVPGGKTAETSTLWKSNRLNATALDVHPFSDFVLAAIYGDGIHQFSLKDGNHTKLKSMEHDMYGAVVISPDGKYAAALSGGDAIEVWDLSTGSSKILEQSRGNGVFCLQFSPDGTLFSSGPQLDQWDLKDGSVKTLIKSPDTNIPYLGVSKSGRYLAIATRVAPKNFQLELHDLELKKSKLISSHGNRVWSVAFDPQETRLITGDFDGIVRVGPISGETPHVLLGHSSPVKDIAVDPLGKWIATRETNPGVRLWPMPSERKPLDSLSQSELVNYLRSLTNVRAASDQNSPTGYSIRTNSN